MSRANLHGVEIKLDRAKYHFFEVNRNVTGYLASNPMTCEKSEEPNGDLCYKIRVHQNVPRRLSAVVGDFIHNVRAALDHLVWQLVIENGNAPSDANRFPFSRSAASWNRAVGSGLAGASDKAMQLISRLKAYPGGNDRLNRIHTLDIEDKHRTLIFTGAAVTTITVLHRLEMDNGEEFAFSLPLAPINQIFPVTDGTRVFMVSKEARQGFSETSSEQISIEARLAFTDIDGLTGLILDKTMADMLNCAWKVCKMSDRLLFQSSTLPDLKNLLVFDGTLPTTPQATVSAAQAAQTSSEG